MLNVSLIASRAVGASALALALLSPVHAAPVLQMSTVNSATGIDLTVSVDGIADVYAYQFTLNFNPALLTSLAVTEGSFLSAGGATFFDQGTVDNVTGSVSFVFNTLISFVPGVSGDGDLATFSFDVAQAGLANFSLSDVLFLDSNFSDISVETRDLVAQVGQVPEPASLWLAGVGLFALFGGRAMKRRTA